MEATYRLTDILKFLKRERTKGYSNINELLKYMENPRMNKSRKLIGAVSALRFLDLFYINPSDPDKVTPNKDDESKETTHLHKKALTPMFLFIDVEIMDEQSIFMDIILN